MGKLSHPLPFHSLARRGATKRGAPVRPIALERGNYRQRAQSVDRPETRMDAGLRTRDLPSTRKST